MSSEGSTAFKEIKVTEAAGRHDVARSHFLLPSDVGLLPSTGVMTSSLHELMPSLNSSPPVNHGGVVTSTERMIFVFKAEKHKHSQSLEGGRRNSRTSFDRWSRWLIQRDVHCCWTRRADMKTWCRCCYDERPLVARQRTREENQTPLAVRKGVWL